MTRKRQKTLTAVGRLVQVCAAHESDAVVSSELGVSKRDNAPIGLFSCGIEHDCVLALDSDIHNSSEHRTRAVDVVLGGARNLGALGEADLHTALHHALDSIRVSIRTRIRP